MGDPKPENFAFNKSPVRLRAVSALTVTNPLLLFVYATTPVQMTVFVIMSYTSTGSLI